MKWTPKASNRRGGQTLVEVLVGSVIAMMLLTSLYQVFVGTTRVWTRSQTRVDLQNAGLLAISKMTVEMRRSSLSTATITPAPVAVAFQPPSSSSTVFAPDSYFILYFDDAANQRVVRKTWPASVREPVQITPTPMAQQRRLLASEVATICAAPNGTEQVVAGGVRSMTLTPAAYPDATLQNVYVTVALTLHRDVTSTSGIDESVSFGTAMRNIVP